MEKHFNLADEPWIRVLKKNGITELVSISNAIINAHTYISLANDSPTQDLSILRILLASLHRIFANGLRTEDDALDVWENLYKTKSFPKEPIERYFDTHREEFWLYHPTNPFWQNLESEGKINNISYEKLRSAVLQSDRKPGFKMGYTAEALSDMTDAELARGLITLNQYDDASLKTGSGLGYLASFAAISALGNSLFETLMLNFTTLDAKTGKPWRSAEPYWEHPLPRNTCSGGKGRAKQPIPQEIARGDNLAYLLSKPSRQGHLIPEERIFTSGGPGGYSVGDTVPAMEPMVMRIPKQEKDGTISYIPLIRPSAQLWRDAAAIININDRNTMCPLVRFHGMLMDAGILPENDILRYCVLSVVPGPSNGCLVDFNFQSFEIPAAILSLEANKHFWMTRLCDCVGYAKKAADVYECYCRRVYKAVVGCHEKRNLKTTPKDIAYGIMKREEFYATLDLPFRKWLDEIPEDTQDISSADRMMSEWIRTLWTTVLKAADTTEKSFGPRAQRIRAEQQDGRTVYYSAAEEYLKFRANLNKRLPKATEGGF